MRFIAVILVLLPMTAHADRFDDTCNAKAHVILTDLGVNYDSDTRSAASRQCTKWKSTLTEEDFGHSTPILLGCSMAVAIAIRNTSLTLTAKDKVFKALFEAYCM